MKRALISGFGERWQVAMIHHVVQRQRWRPVYWGVDPAQEAAIKARYPGIIVHRAISVRRFEKPAEFRDRSWPRTDAQVVQELSQYEPIIWPSFLRKVPPGRWAGGLDLKDEYHRVLTFRYYLFRELAPDVVVFGNMPTGLAHYLFYVLARHLSVPTVVMRRVYFSDRLITLLVRSVEEGSTAVRNRYAELTNGGDEVEAILSDDMEQHLERLRGSYEDALPDGFPFTVDRKRNRLRPRRSGLKEYFQVLGDQKARTSASSVLNALYEVFHRRRTLKYYESLARKDDEDRPYVLVCLHYQPEASTIPNGGIFAYQELMIDLLARALPAGWRLLVKEQPSQLTRFNVNPRFRTTRFYDNLLQYPCVQLVSIYEPSFSLIDAAKAVATVTGTVGWEAVNRGVPALVFGHAWYRCCDGVFYVPDESSLREAMSAVESGYHIDRRKIRAFVSAIETEGIHDSYLQHEIGGSPDESEAYGRAIANEFCERLDRLLGQPDSTALPVGDVSSTHRYG